MEPQLMLSTVSLLSTYAAKCLTGKVKHRNLIEVSFNNTFVKRERIVIYCVAEQALFLMSEKVMNM
jgi:hypothetical protein